MTTAETTHRSRAPWWFNLAGHLLEPWVRIRRDPAEPAALLRGDAPICYVIERDGLSDALILDRACREAGLPSPMQPLEHTRRSRSVFALSRRDGWLFGRNRAALAERTVRPAHCARWKVSRIAISRSCRCPSMSAVRPRVRPDGSACCSPKTGWWSAASAACSRYCSTGGTLWCISPHRCRCAKC
jgi:hypothetical protein